MGTVYRAEHLVLKADVAVKVIDREVREGDMIFTRFMREAQAAAALRSPHVVQIFDYGMEGSRPFMVMELLEGETLASRIERMGQLSPAETYRVLSHVARAVGKAHDAGIVHRDLKPDNVFLVHNEDEEIAKVLDFGVAKIEITSLEQGAPTRTGSLLGTPYYMSPEQAQGNKEIDHRSDLWALGVIAFECLTGVRPFNSEGLGDLVIQICIRDIPVPSQRAQVPVQFDEWFARAVARDPADRFQSARELSEALREALGFHREGGSSPESVWSLPAQLSRDVVMSEPTASSPFSEKTWVEPERASPRELHSLLETEGPRSSQWEIVPHGVAAPPLAESSSPLSSRALQDADTEEDLVLPASVLPRRSYTQVVGVGLFALLVGGLGVYAASTLGVWELSPSTEDSSKEAAPSQKNPARRAELAQKTQPEKPEEGTRTERAQPNRNPGAPDAAPGDKEGEPSPDALDDWETWDKLAEELLPSSEQSDAEDEGDESSPAEPSEKPESGGPPGASSGKPDGVKPEGAKPEGAKPDVPEGSGAPTEPAPPGAPKSDTRKSDGPKPELPESLKPTPPPPPAAP